MKSISFLCRETHTLTTPRSPRLCSVACLKPTATRWAFCPSPITSAKKPLWSSVARAWRSLFQAAQWIRWYRITLRTISLEAKTCTRTAVWLGIVQTAPSLPIARKSARRTRVRKSLSEALRRACGGSRITITGLTQSNIQFCSTAKPTF